MIGPSADAAMGRSRSGRAVHIARRVGTIGVKAAVIAVCVYVAGALALFAPTWVDALAAWVVRHFDNKAIAHQR